MEINNQTDTITPASAVLTIGNITFNVDGTVNTIGKVYTNGVPYLTMPELGAITKEPTGIVDRAESIITFADLTRTFTITPVSASFDFYIKGNKHTISSATNLVVPNTTGFYFIYFDSNATLQYLPSFDTTLIYEYSYVATVYWNTTVSKSLLLGDERHGITMDSVTHEYLHLTRGALYVSGFALQGFSIDGDGSLDAHAQFDATSGVFFDEDIKFQYTATAQIPIFYKIGIGAGEWRRKDADTFPIIYSGTAGFTSVSGRIPYNQFTGGAWQLTELTANTKFMLCHYFAVNDTTQKVIGILGTSEYASLNAARLAANDELVNISGLPFQEFVSIGTTIWNSSSVYANTPKAIIASTDLGLDYVDFRRSQGYSITGFASSHSLLSDLDKDDHLQYLNVTRGDARYQPVDSDLTAIAALASTGFISRTGIGTSSTRTITGTVNRITVSNGDGVSGNPAIDIGTDVATIAGTQTLTNKTISGASNTITNVSLASGITGTLPVGNGGTNIITYAVGDIIYASAATTLSKLTAVALGNVLISGGVTTAPSWGKVGLTTHVSGVLAAANGGTGVNNGAFTLTLAGNLVTTGAFNTTFASGFSGTITLPTATSTLATLALAENLTNKTLTSPKIDTSILDVNGNTLFTLTATLAAVNGITFENAATGTSPTFTASGTDTNIGIIFRSKGTGVIDLNTLTINNDGTITPPTPSLFTSAIALQSGSTAVTTSPSDSSTKIATTAFVQGIAVYPPLLNNIEVLFETNFSKEIVSATGTLVTGVAGAGATAILSTATPDFKCIPLFTGTTATGSAFWRFPGAILWTNARDVVFTAEFDYQILYTSSATQRGTVRTGIMGTSNFIADNTGFYFRYTDNVNSGNFQCVVRNGVSETVINTAIAGGLVQKALKMIITVASTVTSVQFFINGVSQGTTTTNIPANGTTLLVGSGNKKTVGTTSVAFYNSYFRVMKVYSAGTRF